MYFSRSATSGTVALLSIALLASSGWTQAPAKTAKHRHPTAEEVSRRVLSRHPKPRDEAEKRIIAVMEGMYLNQSRGMGNVLPEDGWLMRMLAESLGAKHVVELDKARWHFAPHERKKKRRRFVYMTPKAQAIVARLVQKYPSGPIFRNSKGRPCTPFSVNCRFQRLAEGVGRKLCLYLFRRSYITGKLVAGFDSTIVKDLAGHVDAQMINRVYGHAAENWEFMADQAKRNGKFGFHSRDDEKRPTC